RNQLANIYRLDRAFVRDGQFLDHPRMRYLVVGAATPWGRAQNAIFAAERLDILDPPVAPRIVPHILKASAHGVDLHHCADLPRHDLGVAIAELFGLRALAGSGRQHLAEDLLALLLYAHAVEDVAAVDVHVVDHARIDLAVGRELDRRR